MRWLALALLLAPSGALGASGKVGKALKALDKFDAGDRAALDTARKAAEQATASSDDPEAWAVRGRVYLLHLTNPDLPRPDGDPAILAVESFEKAVALGASGSVHGQLSRWVPILESTVTTALLNDVEGKQWDAAAARLELALRVRAVGDGLGGRDDEREAQARRLAVQVTTRTGHLDEARAHYLAFVDAAGRHDPGLAGLVARELATAGDLQGALAFLQPLDDELPDDERLLRTEVELLREGDRLDEAVARVDKAAETLRGSVSGAFLAAGLYAEAGADERARELWEQTLALDARHFEAHLLLGRSLLDEASDIAARLEDSEQTQSKRPDPELRALAEELADLRQRVEAHLLAAHELDSQRREPVEALIASVEAHLAEAEGDEALEARLADLRGKLAALEE